MKKMYEKLKKLYTSHKELAAYLIFGGLTTLVNFAVTYVLFKLLSIPIDITTVIAWIISVLFAYITNRLFVFERKQLSPVGILAEMAGFFAARLISGVLDVVIMVVGVDNLGINFGAVKMFSQVFVVIFNYFASKWFIFRSKP